MVESYKIDELPEPAEYARQLDDAQLVALAAHVQERIAALVGQGVPLPMGQIENHHLLGLLEALAGPEMSLRVREWHLTWTDRQLDQAETMLRLRLIESGLLDGAGP